MAEPPKQPATPNLDRVKHHAKSTRDIAGFLLWLVRHRGGKALLKKIAAVKTDEAMKALLDRKLAEYFGVDLEAVAAEQKANVQWAADMMAYRLQQDGGGGT
jgi:hypothetical protein